MKFPSILSLSGILMISNASAVVLVTENFDYPDGSLTSNPAWSTHSGNPADLLVAGGAAVVQHGAPSEDASIGFAATSSGVLSASFDIVVSDDAVIGNGGTDFEYFAHFFTDGSFNFRSRVDIQAPVGGGDYTMGISSSSSTAEATLPVDFNFGDTVSVLLEFNLDTGLASLTVGGNTIDGTTSFLGDSLDRFALRQSDSSNNETITVDNLVISDSSVVPEPTTALLGGLALLGLLGRRRA